MTQARRRLVTEAGRANPVRPVHVWAPRDHPGVPVLVVAHLDVYARMHEHAVASLPNETGGFLLGRVSFDAQGPTWLVEIDEALSVEPGQQDPVHFSFDWRDVDRVRTYRQERDKALIGWYHTHPGLPIFLSETDLNRAHRVLFAEPFQVALVYDPVRGRAGYFYWEGPQTIDPSEGDWREFAIAIENEAEPEAIGVDVQTPALAPPDPGAPEIGAPEAALTPADATARAMTRAAMEGVAMVAAPARTSSSESTAAVPPIVAASTRLHAAEADDGARTSMMPSSLAGVAPAVATAPQFQEGVAAGLAPSRRWMMLLLIIALVSLGFSAALAAMLVLGKLHF